MQIVQTRVRIGDDRTLNVKLADTTPTGDFKVTIVLEADHGPASAEQRRAAALAGLGALRDFGGSVDEFLAERREEDERRDKALGL